ncbi:ATP-binding cassette domain-containing protein [Mycolicibacterium sp. XJ870]
MNSGVPGIIARGLVKHFDRGGGLPEPVHLTVPAGTLTLVTGTPGAGKSTLVRCLTGVYRPDAGNVTFRLGADAIDLTGADPRTVAWLRGRHLASFDGPLVAAPRLAAAAAVARAARCDPTSALGALTRLGAEHLAAIPVGRLRPAGRDAVGLAAVLQARRPFIVLDEPEAAADAASVATWVQHALQAGAAVFATGTTDSALASIATAAGELRKGRIQWRKR